MPDRFETKVIGRPGPPLGRSTPGRYRQAALITIGVMGMSGCDDGIKLRNSPADSLATNRYVELLRAEFSAADPIAAHTASYCELARLQRVYTNLHGYGYSVGLLRAAEKRAFRDIPDSTLKRHERSLPQVWAAREDHTCAELARAGVLGDTIYPPAGEWKP